MRYTHKLHERYYYQRSLFDGLRRRDIAEDHLIIYRFCSVTSAEGHYRTRSERPVAALRE